VTVLQKGKVNVADGKFAVDSLVGQVKGLIEVTASANGTPINIVNDEAAAKQDPSAMYGNKTFDTGLYLNQ
jgi:ABC-type siderophore export system fused ATPase/permease subunit